MQHIGYEFRYIPCPSRARNTMGLDLQKFFYDSCVRIGVN